MPVGAAGGRAPVGVDRHDRRAGLAGLDHQAPEVAVGVDGVRAPVDDELALRDGQRIGPQPAAAHRVFVAQPRRPRRRSSGRASTHPGGGRTAGRGCSTGACPSCRSSCRAGSPAGRRPSRRSRRTARRSSSRASSQVIGSNRPSPLRPDPLHRLEQAIGAIDPLEVPGHLLAKKPAREAMIGVAAQLDRHAVLDRHQHAARVGAVERADVLDHGQCGIAFRCRHGDSLPLRRIRQTSDLVTPG